MGETLPRTAIIVLVLDDVEDTLVCVNDFIALPQDRFTMFLCDNGSREDCFAELAARLPAVPNLVVVRSGRNLGFAAGNAFGLGHVDLAAFDFVLLLNNDTTFSSRDLMALVEAADHTNADVAGPTIVYADHPETVWQAGGHFNHALMHLSVPAMNGPSYALAGPPRRVDFVSGCAMLIRTSLIRRIGFLDDAYFYSVEDLDYCLTAHAAGANVVHVIEARIGHHVSRTAGGWDSPFALRHNLWGKGRLIAKHAGTWTRISALVFHLVAVIPGKWVRSRNRRLVMLLDAYRAFIMGLRGAPLVSA